MQLHVLIEILKKGKWYVARAPELDFVSQGPTLDEARGNLLELIRIQFSEMREMGTLEDYLSECGFELAHDQVVQKTDVVGFEKSVVYV